MEGYNDIIQQQPSIKNAVSTQGTQWDPTNALALSQTDDLIELFVLKACGLHKIKVGQEYKLRRFNKPMLSYEFAHNFYNSLFTKVNHITGRSKVTAERINDYMLKNSQTISLIMASEGMNNVISDKVWMQALLLLSYDPEEMNKPINLRKNMWWTRHGIDWDFNDHFTLRMLYIIKNNYLVDEKSIGEGMILRHFAFDGAFFFNLGANRSEEALTLEHEKVIHKETLVNTSDKDNKSSEGRLEGVKRFIRGLTG